MRQRPKQANYLDKFGEKKEVQAKGIDKVRKEKAQVAKKSQVPTLAKRGKTNLIEKRHITPQSATDYGWASQEDESLNEGSKISQFISLDEIPDSMHLSSFQSENRSNASNPMVPPRKVINLDDMDSSNYWAQPSPKAKQIKKSEFVEQQQQQSSRVVVDKKQPGSEWGMDDGEQVRDSMDEYNNNYNNNNNISALTSLDDYPEQNVSPRYEEIRGEHVPSGHNRAVRQVRNHQQQQGGGVINQIAKMPTMKRMQPMGDAGQAGGKMVGAGNVSPPRHIPVDHGFSPPRRAAQAAQPNNARREYSPVEVPPLPVQQAQRLPDFPSIGSAPVSGRVSERSTGRGSGSRGGAPDLHKQFGKFRRGNFGGEEQQDDDDDDYYEELEVDSVMDPPSARSKGVRSPRSPRSYKQPHQPQRQRRQQQVSPLQSRRSRSEDDFDFDDDSEMGPSQGYGSPARGYSKAAAAGGPYNQRQLNLGVSAGSPPKISMVSTAAPALPCEKEEAVPEDQKLYYSKQPRQVEYKPRHTQTSATE